MSAWLTEPAFRPISGSYPNPNETAILARNEAHNDGKAENKAENRQGSTESWPSKQTKGNSMTIISYLIPIGLAAVVLVLLAGLLNMLRGGSASLSQTLMRWRVGLQFAVVVLVMLFFYFSRQPM